MIAAAQKFRYHLPRKAIKGNCPDCGSKHRKTFSRYVDSLTGEPLPENYGRCDRESNCGYHYSPYHKTASGQSYADEVYQRDKLLSIPKEFFTIAKGRKQAGASRKNINNCLKTSLICTESEQAEATARHLFDQSKAVPAIPKVHTIPDEIYALSLGHYERNQFARLLTNQFGPRKANELIQRFHIGTSAHWPGACVFWLVDEQGRKRGGQIKLFANDWHTAKHIDNGGTPRSQISWVHIALQERLKQNQKPLPDWLIEYSRDAVKSPCLFGLSQLATASANTPIAIVEAPKTAVVCSSYVPRFIWLAVMGKSYLKPERLAAVRDRLIILYPDLNALHDTINAKGHKVKGWSTLANELRSEGFNVKVSDFLEQNATVEQRAAGLDLADFLLEHPPTVSTITEQLAQPGTLLRVEEADIERLPSLLITDYPAEWDAPSLPNATPAIKQITYWEWQQRQRF